MSDDEFLARLAAYLGWAADGIEPGTPIFKNDESRENPRLAVLLEFQALEQAWPCGTPQ